VSSQVQSAGTDVILVVKGAGIHQPDEVVNQFLQGFWPAVLKLDPDATIRQRHDDELFEDYKPAPHTEKAHNHLTEINAHIKGEGAQREKRCVWVREVYWDDELTPPPAFRVLFDEWHMASYALRRELSNYYRSLILTIRGILSRFGRSASTENKPSDTNKIELTKRNEFFSIYGSYAFIYFIAGTLFLNAYRYAQGFSDYTQKFETFQQFVETLFNLGLTTGALVLPFALLLALPNAYRTYWRKVDQRDRLPGLENTILILLMLTFFMVPSTYIVLFLVYSFPVLITLICRGIYWQSRPHANRDRDYTGILLPHPLDTTPGNVEGEVIQVHSVLLFPYQQYYRSVVVLGIPIAILALGVIKLLKLIKVLKDLTDWLEEKISLLLSKGLGDLSAYALDPAQSHRIRSTIETDIRYFAQKDEVGKIHIFAHSQGTPITFETLFHHLPDEDRTKIKTYVTIGSVLSHYYDIAPMLDQVSTPSRFRKRAYPTTFAEDFLWFNFWNLADNVTEFYGLDRYEKSHIVTIGGELKEVKIPINIKTRSKGHSDYWTNIDEVHLPFAKRVLNLDAWDVQWKPQASPSGLSYQFKVNATTLAIVVMSLLGLVALAGKVWQPQSLYPPFYQRLLTSFVMSMAESELGIIADSLAYLQDPNKLGGIRDLWAFLGENLNEICLAFLIVFLTVRIGAFIMNYGAVRRIIQKHSR
jgi:hypothetical protein